MTDLSGYAKKSTANGDTRSGLRLRLRIAVPGRAADADPPQHLTCGKFNSRSLVAGFHPVSIACSIRLFLLAAVAENGQGAESGPVADLCPL